MRGDHPPDAYGWLSDSAIAHLVGDDPTDELPSTRASSPEIGLLGALLVVTIGDVRRGDPDALVWLEGEHVEGPALRLADVAGYLGMEAAALRGMIERAARNGTRARRQMVEPARRHRRRAA